MFGFIRRWRERRRYRRTVEDWLATAFRGFAPGTLAGARAGLDLDGTVAHLSGARVDPVSCAVYALRLIVGAMIERMDSDERAACLASVQNRDAGTPFYRGLDYLFEVLDRMQQTPGVSEHLVESFPYYVVGKLRGLSTQEADAWWAEAALERMGTEHPLREFARAG
jgi:hypothetical protein